jgi:hypothetical protein
MVIVEMATGREVKIAIAPVESKDLRQITKRRYFFDWKREHVVCVGKLASRKHFRQACVSLLPKTELRAHYQREYGMLDAGPQLYLEGPSLQAIINKYAA